MFALRLKLKMTEATRRFADRCFAAVNKLHNTLVKHAEKLLRRLQADKEYQEWVDELVAITKQEPERQDVKRLNELKRLTAGRRSELGLTQYGLCAWCQVWRRRYKNLVSGHQAQTEVSRVWKGIEAVLFDKGKSLHFRKLTDMRSIGNSDNASGVIFDPVAMRIRWLGHEISCRANPNDSYIEEALKEARLDTCKGVDKDRVVRHCEIVRLPFRNGYHYYANVLIAGCPPNKGRTLGEGRMGVDPGISTVAAVADNDIFLEELAPAAMGYDKQIARIQRRMEMSRRDGNPENYTQDGAVKKGGKSWSFTNHYIRLRWKLRDLLRRKAAYTEQSHNGLANKMTAAADTFLIEENNFDAMARRVKKTVRSEKESIVIDKNGKEKTVRKFKRRRRLGRSVRNRAPAKFLAILLRKAESLGGVVRWIDPFKFRASQYRHDTDCYEKVPLSERNKIVDGRLAQRDLYSAFLIKHSDPSGTKPDRRWCADNFSGFCILQERKIARMMMEGISMKHCFGF